jgi:hypothetical protein
MLPTYGIGISTQQPFIFTPGVAGGQQIPFTDFREDFFLLRMKKGVESDTHWSESLLGAARKREYITLGSQKKGELILLVPSREVSPKVQRQILSYLHTPIKFSLSHKSQTAAVVRYSTSAT